MDLLLGLCDEHADGSKRPRGRPPSALSTNFYRLREKCNKIECWTVCKNCYAVHVNDNENAPFPACIHGRKDAREKHMSECSYYTRVTGCAFHGEDEESNAGDYGCTNKAQRALPPGFTTAELRMFREPTKVSTVLSTDVNYPTATRLLFRPRGELALNLILRHPTH